MNLNLFDDSGFPVMSEKGFENKPDMMYREEKTSVFPNKTPLAMAYVPYQEWGEIIPHDKALECGTIFKDLVFPFEGGAVK